MTTGELLFLALVICAVSVFVAVLAYNDFQQRKEH